MIGAEVKECTNCSMGGGALFGRKVSFGGRGGSEESPICDALRGVGREKVSGRLSGH